MTPSPTPTLRDALSAGEEKMKKSVESFRRETSSIRTGRASAALLDGVKVDYFGAMVPLKQAANIGVPDGRTLEIKPWDVSTLPALEKAILASGLGLTPNNDGKIIRLNLPTLTEERRKDLVRVVKKLAEDFRVSIRNDRREALDKIKKLEKDKLLSEDQRKGAEHGLQELTDRHIRQVDEALAHKEKEILEI
jgi:ribosome recycling factor